MTDAATTGATTPDLHTTAGKLADFRRRNDELLHAGSERAVEKQHAKGKKTARERIEQLLDEDSFVELDGMARHRSSNFGQDRNRPYGDGVITGYGTIDHRPVCVFAQDFTVFGGSLGEVFGEKIVKVMDLAMKIGCPVVGINDSGGARIQEGVVSLGLYGEIFRRNVHASGVIPQISLIMGPCAGGAVYSPAITDFIVMVENTSHMFITGPDVIKTVTGEDVEFEDLGGARSHNTKSGVAHYAASDEDDAIEYVRELLSYLPQNNLEEANVFEYDDEPHINAEDEALNSFIPDSANMPYDMHTVIETVLDDGAFTEVHALFAPNMVCGFGRVEGRSVGIVANQPMQFAGTLDIDASEKAARFVRTCDAFHIPVITFVDVPGFLPSSAAARSSSTRTPRRRCRSSRSSPARRMAARTTSWGPSTSARTSTWRGRPPRSPSWAPRVRSTFCIASSSPTRPRKARTSRRPARSSSSCTKRRSQTPTSLPSAATSTR